MKKTLLLAIVIGLSLFSTETYAQSEKCATMQVLEKRIQQNPALKQQMEQSEIQTQDWISSNPNFNRSRQIITIPVVVHVIWNDPVQNVSDAQIYSQIDVLNEDFRLLNADSLDNTHPFWIYTADAQIEFCLATRTPDGNATTGITRTQTSVVAWGEDDFDYIKYTAYGGRDNWDPTQYLNIYVVNLDGSTLGFAAFPDELVTNPDLDGVVIRYEAFGNIGTAGSGDFSLNDGGRTGTHEVGHWLNLRHIWGDDNCGDDFVEDTETAEGENYGCPSFPHRAFNSCGSGESGEMYMNYMDYVDDHCMNMFTFGQAQRMYAALNGPRAGLLTSQGCQAAVSVQSILSANDISVYPNPNNGSFTIDVSSIGSKNITVKMENVLGEIVREFDTNSSTPIHINSDNKLQSGIYFIRIDAGNNNVVTKKIFIIN
ncbi:MAG: T9SS type A sorting domain-containing protein [Bacteroidetes bacterium]|nr:T9SS type A sorting domain-containing protein [Bacteroidota bacterium]